MTRMFLYLLEIRESAHANLRHSYDVNQGFVVRAKSSYDARKIANGRAADEGTIWDNPNLTSCRRIGEVTPGASTKPGIVLTDFYGC